MNERERVRLRAQMMGDQAAAAVRAYRPDLERLTKSDPSTWTARDIEIVG